MKPHRLPSLGLALMGWALVTTAPLKAKAAPAPTDAPPAPRQRAADAAEATRAPEAPGRVEERGDVTVGKGETVGGLAVTLGTARVDGEVKGDVVVTLGRAHVDGEVWGDLLVLLGNAKVSGTVHGDAVTLGGTLVLEDGAHVVGDAIGLGGGVQRSSRTTIDGKLVSKGIESLPAALRERARLFFHECVMMLRPLSPRVDFVWWLWGGLVALEALLALLFPSAVQRVGVTLRERPAASLLVGLASIPLGLLVGVTLSMTLVLSPAALLLFAAGCMGTALGEASFMRLLGAALLRGIRPASFPGGLEFAVGAVSLTALMLVPWVGLIVWTTVDLWVLGAVVLTWAGGRHATRDVTPAPPPPTPPVTSGGGAAVGGPDTAPPWQGAAVAWPGPDLHAAPVGPVQGRRWQDADPGPGWDAAAISRAQYPSLRRRLGALLVDWVPLLALASRMPDALPWLGLEDPAAAFRVVGGIAYFAGMMAWRGTTLGGMIAGLRVVRLDGRPMDRPTAVVRALAAVLSVLSLGLGWVWARWDDRQQTWHDRLAGTVVVRDDSGRSLV